MGSNLSAVDLDAAQTFYAIEGVRWVRRERWWYEGFGRGVTYYTGFDPDSEETLEAIVDARIALTARHPDAHLHTDIGPIEDCMAYLPLLPRPGVGG